MICRRCGSDVAPTKFCSRCGALLNGKRCNSCGGVMGINDTVCSDCGAYAQNYNPPVLPPPQNYGPPQGGQYYTPAPQEPVPLQANANPFGSDNQVKMRLKKRIRPVTPTGSKYPVLRSFIGALGSLAALGLMVYFVFFANLLTDGSGNAFSPLLFSPETFTLFPQPGNFTILSGWESIIAYFTSFGANIGSFFGDNLWKSLPALLFQLAYFVAIIMLVIAVIFALIRLLTGLLGKKDFDLMLPVQLGLGGLLSMYIALLMISAEAGYNFVSYSSGLMIGIYAGFGAIVWQTLMNLFRAGRRFLKAGSVMKWLTNLAFFAGAVVMLIGVPLTVTINGADVSPITWFATTIASGGELDMMRVVLVGGIAVAMIGFIWGLSASVAKTGKRLSRTFKFDGYSDKGCFLRGLFALITAVSFGALVFFGTDGDLSQVYLLLTGGAIMFVAAVFNRIFLNKDQL